jgi:predicted O-methyltransferase YrrM
MYNYEYVAGKGLPKLLDYESPTTILEIGTAIGETAEYFLMQLPKTTVHIIDPYVDYVDWNGNQIVSQDNMYNYVLARFQSYGDRFVPYRKFSDDAFNDFAEDQFDLIFIDGLHTYEQVLKDCENYYSKLKTGGVFSGHDFSAIEGVGRAVKEFSNKVGKDIMFTESDVWYWVK